MSGTLALAMALIAGVLFIQWAVRDADRHVRADLLRQSRMLVDALNTDLAIAVSDSHEYERLTSHFADVLSSVPGWSRIYMLTRDHDGEVMVMLDSVSEESGDHAPLDLRVEQTASALNRVFDTGRSETAGPLADGRSEKISAFVPVAGPHTGRILSVLGIDLDADDWRRAIRRAALVPSSLLLALLIVIVAGFGMMARRNRMSVKRRYRYRYLEAGMAGGIGAIFTLSAMWFAHDHESDHRDAAFATWSHSITAYVVDALHQLEELRVEGLARFFEGGGDVRPEEFDHYTAYLARIPEVRTWGWASVVPSDELERFETDIHETGQSDFYIWERDDNGAPIPVTNRAQYYPVTYMNAVAGHKVAVGFDLGSEATRRAAVEEAMRTDMVTATDPVALLSDGQPGTLVFRAVRDELAGERIVGFSFAVLDWEKLMEAAISGLPGRSALVSVELQQWHSGKTPYQIAASSDSAPAWSLPSSLRVSRPVFAFGKAYGMVMRPSPEFMAEYPLHHTWFIFFAGMGLTSAVVFGIAAMTYRREELERLVEGRTAALREGVERFDELAAQSRTVIWELDTEGRYTYVSQEAEAVWGYRPEELVGKKYFYELHPEEGRETFKVKAFEMVAENEPFVDLENPVQTPAGRIVWVTSNGVPKFDAGGELTGYRGMDQDITARKEGEERSKEESIRRRILIDQSQDGIVVLDENGAVYEANRRFSEMIGYSPEETSGLHVWDWEVLHNKAELLEMLRCVDEHGDHFVTQHQRKDGTLYDVEISTNGAVFSGQKLVFCVCRDISERRRAEAERERLFIAMEQASESIIITDANGVIQYVNRYFEKVSGYTKEEAIGKTPRLLKSGKQGDEFYADLWRNILAGDVWRGKLINRRKDGSEFHEEAVITPVRDGEGKVINYVAVKRDATREEELNRQLTHAQKMEAIGLLAGGVAHDFNNILTVILGNANILQRALEGQDALETATDEIANAASRAAEMTRQLLTFSRKEVVMPRHIDLNEAVDGMKKMITRLVPEDIKVSVNLCDRPLPIFADPGQIEQILLNLVVNARDAVSRGGLITVETCVHVPLRSSAETFIEAHELWGRDMAAIFVRDDGVGMAPHQIERIFEPFYTTKDVGKGTGLGLSTVFGIVQQHKGTMSVESTPGKGSVFRVLLPLADTADEGKAPFEAEASNLRGTETVLLIEDDTGVLSVVANMLRNLGYTVLKATGGAEGLELARTYEGRIDLLVTDIVMPGMSGVEVAEELRRDWPDLSVLYASGYPSDHLARAGLSRVRVELVRKPFNEAELSRKVRLALQQ